jgi:ABC-type dipeptide/oligopeptide/nickel transport system ATPase component
MHPYTEGLFNSLPNIKDRKAKLKPIKGLMPDPTIFQLDVLLLHAVITLQMPA